jgi:hypothetical protein
LPNAPTNVTSYLGARGVVVKWTPGASVAPGVIGHVVSAGAGSCPIFVPIRNNSVVTMPVVAGQPAGTPVVQAVNAYGFSKPAASNKSYTAEQLATVVSSNSKAVQILQLSDFHGAIDGTSFGAALLTSNWPQIAKPMQQLLQSHQAITSVQLHQSQQSLKSFQQLRP